MTGMCKSIPGDRSMKNIILTVTDKQRRFLYDMEVPVTEPGYELAEDVMEVLNEGNPGLYLNARYHCVYINRLGRVLSDQESLAQAHVRNGDYVTIISRI